MKLASSRGFRTALGAWKGAGFVARKFKRFSRNSRKDRNSKNLFYKHVTSSPCQPYSTCTLAIPTCTLPLLSKPWNLPVEKWSGLTFCVDVRESSVSYTFNTLHILFILLYVLQHNLYMLNFYVIHLLNMVCVLASYYFIAPSRHLKKLKLHASAIFEPKCEASLQGTTTSFRIFCAIATMGCCSHLRLWRNACFPVLA